MRRRKKKKFNLLNVRSATRGKTVNIQNKNNTKENTQCKSKQTLEKTKEK
jgi:hypothetical protein